MHAPCIFMPLLNEILVGGKHVASGAQSQNPVASPCVPVSLPSTDVPDVLPVCHNLVMVSHVMSTSMSFQFYSKLIPIWFPFRPCPKKPVCPTKRFDFHRKFPCFSPLFEGAIHPIAMLPGAKWDMNAGCLADADTMALFNPMPIVLTWDPHQDIPGFGPSPRKMAFDMDPIIFVDF